MFHLLEHPEPQFDRWTKQFRFMQIHQQSADCWNLVNSKLYQNHIKNKSQSQPEWWMLGPCRSWYIIFFLFKSGPGFLCIKSQSPVLVKLNTLGDPKWLHILFWTNREPSRDIQWNIMNSIWLSSGCSSLETPQFSAVFNPGMEKPWWSTFGWLYFSSGAQTK